MEILWMIIIGLLSGLVGLVAFPLSLFIGRVEDETVCLQCSKLERCFAKRKIYFGKSDWLNEFMLLAYLSVCKHCKHAKGLFVLKKECYIYLLSNVLLVGVLFWSEEILHINVLYGIACGALLALSVVDWNTQYIPVELSGIIFICGLIRIFYDLSNWVEYVIGLLTVSGFLFLVNYLFTPLLRKRYMEENIEIDGVIGDGDIKLMAATGLLLGWKLNLLALALGCITGSVVHVILMIAKKGERQFALGPYLSIGVYMSMLFGKQLIGWYLSLWT